MTKLQGKIRNDYWIWKSEKEKNTCEKCKSLDGKIFYFEDEIPEKPHPNCKCEVVKVVSEDSLNNKREQENIQTELKFISKKLNDLNSTQKQLSEKIAEEKLNYETLNKTIKTLEEIYTAHMDLQENRNNVKERFIEINNLKKTIDDNAYDLIKLGKALVNTTTDTLNSININYAFFVEKMEDFIFDENGLKEDMNNIKEAVSSATKEMDFYYKELNSLIKSKMSIQGKIEALFKYQQFIDEQSILVQDTTINKVSAAVQNASSKAISTMFPLAGSNLRDSLNDFEYAKKNPNAYVTEAGNKKNTETIKQTISDLKIPNGKKIVVYNANSYQSRKLALSKAIRNFIKKNREKLIKGDSLKDELLSYNVFSEPDAYFALQHFTIHDAKITKDGYFEAIVYDKYDFEKREGFFLDPKISINNTGNSLQGMGKLQNYHEIYCIREKLW